MAFDYAAELVELFGGRGAGDPVISLSPKQAIFERDRARMRTWIGGRRSGKTHGEAVHMLRNSLPGEVTPYCAPTIGIGRSILWPHLERLAREFAIPLRWNRSDSSVVIPNGGVIKVFGLSTIAEAEKLRGQRYPLAVIDECGAIAERILKYAVVECLSPATKDFLGRGGRGVVLAGTPSKVPNTWWHKQVLLSESRNAHHYTTIWDNPFFAGREQLVIDEYLEEFQLKESDAAVQREIWGRFCVDMQGLCYHWSGTVVSQATVPLGATLMAVDFGYTHPAAFVVIRVSGGVAYVLHVFKQEGMTDHAIAAKIQELRRRFDVGYIVGDSEAATSIQTLRQNFGIPIEPAKKAGSKQGRITFMDSCLKADTLRFCEGSTELQHEVQTVGWNEDRDDHHERQSDHACDATHYGLEYASQLKLVTKPLPPAHGSPEWYKLEEDRMFRQATIEGRALREKERNGRQSTWRGAA